MRLYHIGLDGDRKILKYNVTHVKKDGNESSFNPKGYEVSLETILQYFETCTEFFIFNGKLTKPSVK